MHAQVRCGRCYDDLAFVAPPPVVAIIGEDEAGATEVQVIKRWQSNRVRNKVLHREQGLKSSQSFPLPRMPLDPEGPWTVSCHRCGMKATFGHRAVGRLGPIGPKAAIYLRPSGQLIQVGNR